LRRGSWRNRRGRPVGAVEQYREALKIDPKHQPSLYRLGMIYTQQKAYPQAIETWPTISHGHEQLAQRV
jgi:cytochrome c-type biogenesis protein CcmH/NrfG